MLKVDLPVAVELDPNFVPAVLWNREFRKRATRDVLITLERENGSISRYETSILTDSPENFQLNLFYFDRLLKFLLWGYSGWRVTIAGADELLDELRDRFSASGERKFDFYVIGGRTYRRPLEIIGCDFANSPKAKPQSAKVGGHTNGCRIGFDLGGSDRKCAAVIDGECVFTEEVAWDPYFQRDWHYHLDGIRDSLKRAAAHLPRVDAIGGSAAGIYVNNQPRLASLFRGIGDNDFDEHILTVFEDASAEFGKVPIVVLNDGEVTALAGANSFGKKAMLGLSMGTSEAVGYVDENGDLTDWLNEMAMTPIDYRITEDKVQDEWSKDYGVGASFLSQQAVARLAPVAGFDFGTMAFPEQLKEVQKAMESNDPRAAAIYRTLGAYLGYAVAHYADFYRIENLLLLGRVSSGAGGEIIIDVAKKVLAMVTPELDIEFMVPDEKFKRHGQAMVAASLPEVK